jgi:hypothetical protein
MPQLDNFSFFSQTFWVLFFFLSFYFLNLYYVLPGLAAVLKLRKHVIASVKKNSSDNTNISFVNFSGEDFLASAKILTPEIKQSLILKSSSSVQKVLLSELSKKIPKALASRSVLSNLK